MRKLGCAAAVLWMGGAGGVYGQTVPPESGPTGARAVQLPLSGRTGQAGSVQTVQNPLPSGLQSVNTITSTVQVQGAYQGSVPSAAAPGLPLSLSLDAAVKRGLEYNLGAVSNRNSVLQSRGYQRVEHAALLPHVSADLLVTEEQLNLAALGFSGNIPGIPSVVGPFHYFDLRAGVSQSVFSLTELRNDHSSSQQLEAARLSALDARDLVTLAVAGGYLDLIAAAARVDTARAQVATAEATFRQARDQLAAGVVPRIDLTRSQVELQTQQQRLTSLANNLAKLRIYFARLIGLPPAQDYSITDTLPYAPLKSLTLDQALLRAYAYRSDLKAAAAQARAAEFARQAAVAEHYPRVEFGADYGVIGPSPGNSHGTFTVTGAVRVPIFEGGRIRGDIEQADAALAQRRAEYQDLHGRIEAEVRTAFLDLTTAADQVAVAESNRKLAAETLKYAQDRFAAGVTDTLEVVQAEESVAAAEQDYISSVYSHNLAKATLARAMGQAGPDIKQFLEQR
jgi:outer membrane protein TolC